MNHEFRQMVIETLQRGEDLPREWARELFPPEKREYELVYYDKQREEDIIADTMAVPLQAVRTFSKNGEDWHNMLIFGDNLQALKRLLVMKNEGELCNADGTPGVRLIYIDPPFATKQEFRGSQDQKAYQDKIAGARFVEFLRKRLVLIRELLSEDGSLYLHLDQRKAHYAKVIADEIFGEHNFQNEIIWRNTNSHNKANTFGQIHQSIFLYTRTSEYLFNKTYRPRFRKYVESHYRHEDQDGRYRLSDLTGEGQRTGESGKEWRGYNPTEKNRHWAIPGYIYDFVEDDISGLGILAKLDYLYGKGFIGLPDTSGGQPQIKRWEHLGTGNPIQDVWAYQPYTQSIYAGSEEAIDQDVSWAVSKDETTGYPTQKPEGLLRRIVESSSKDGDIVLDAFAGSGTTCAVAEKLGRRWIGIDCGKLAIYTIQKRMLNLKTEIGNKGRSLRAKPFTLYNAGLYDFSTLKQLDWEGWRFFALQLFECKDEPHTIGGYQCDGKRKGASVKVFNHQANPGKRIDEETIEQIHSYVGKKISNKFYIIAPSRVFDFQQDYIDIDGVRYYALRIPYSIINELHRRAFTALEQPKDERAINETVDAVGFDFIQLPEAEYTVGVKRREGQLLKEAFLKIRKFRSRARLRSEDVFGEMETLSMLMLDYDFKKEEGQEEEVFDLDAVFYGNELEANNWQAFFPHEGIGEKVMAVFIDIHGNEARRVISREEFGIEKLATPRQNGKSNGKTNGKSNGRRKK